MNPLVLAVISICLSVAAQFLLKVGMSSSAVKTASASAPGISVLLSIFSQPYVIAGFVLYGLGAMVWLSVLSRWDVSKAYPLVGIGFAFTALIGLMMGEQVGLLRGCGVALICTGVWMVSQS
jgi:multidrug transporter EmrE-like cation transporter